MMTLLYTGGASVEPPVLPCQPVITSFEAVFVTMNGPDNALVAIVWAIDNAESFTVSISGPPGTVIIATSGTETEQNLQLGVTYDFTLTAICGELTAEETISYTYDPCPGTVTPIVSLFDVSQDIQTGAVTFQWEATEITQADIYNNDVLVATSTDMIWLELTPNGTLRGGSVTIPQPAILGQQTFTLKAINFEYPQCVGEATQSILLIEGDQCLGVILPTINSFSSSQDEETGEITFSFAATGSFGQPVILRDGVSVATGVSPLTISRPATSGTYILRCFAENQACSVEMSHSVTLIDDSCFAVNKPVISEWRFEWTFFELGYYHDRRLIWTATGMTTLNIYTQDPDHPEIPRELLTNSSSLSGEYIDLMSYFKKSLYTLECFNATCPDATTAQFLALPYGA